MVPRGELVPGVGHAIGKVEKELPVVVTAHEVEREFREEIVRVLLFPASVIARENHLLAAAPEVVGIVVVGTSLVEETKPVIKSLCLGMPGGARFPQSPLTGHPGEVARFLEYLGDRDIPGPQGNAAPPSSQALHPAHPKVAPDGSVSGVLAGHEDAARGGTNGGPRVTLDEPGPLLRHPVQPRGPDHLLPVAPQISIAKIVRHDEDEIRRVRRTVGSRGCPR